MTEKIGICWGCGDPVHGDTGMEWPGYTATLVLHHGCILRLKHVIEAHTIASSIPLFGAGRRPRIPES